MNGEHKQFYQRKSPFNEGTDSSWLTDLDLIGIKPGLSAQK